MRYIRSVEGERESEAGNSLSSAQSRLSQLEVLDLRHFSGAQLRPLLRDEAERWRRRLHWDYTQASGMLLDYLDSRILLGYVALQAGQVAGYAFCVCEGAKAVIGDVYAFEETETTVNPICETLMDHLLEMVGAMPGVERVESQLLMFPDGALGEAFQRHGFKAYPRCFMLRDLHAHPPRMERDPVESRPGRSLVLEAWRPEFYDGAAQLIHRCYSDHMDAGINDQYRTLQGAQRFLHNIIRFPGCGVFDPENSWVVRETQERSGASPLAAARGGSVEAVLLSSRVCVGVNHITQICVAPSLRGQGLGRMLLEHSAREGARRGVRELSLTVTEANVNARELYERNGFVTLHRFEAMVFDSSVRG
jgi:ribosomal protein S18 acetylase RimI-like enzyme